MENFEPIGSLEPTESLKKYVDVSTTLKEPERQRRTWIRQKHINFRS